MPILRPILQPIVAGVAGGSARQAWAAAQPSLRTYITANYDQPNPHNQAVMASPPTVTAAGTSLPAGMAVSISISPSTTATSALRILGGTMVSVSSNQRIWAATLAATGGNLGTNDGKNCSAWRADIICDASVVSFRVAPSSAKYRFIVDGQYVDLTGTQTVATTGNTAEYIKLDFTAVGGKASRRITIEGMQTDGLLQVWCKSGETLTRPSDTPKKLAFVGDSFTYGSGAVQQGDNFAWVCADTLGFRYSLNSGAGGTGYVADNSGTGYKLSQRLTDINGRDTYDIIVVEMGYNDIGLSTSSITSEVTTCLTSFRGNNPTAQIFVVGPWDKNAPAAPVANYAATKSAIQAGIPAGAGITFLDPQGVSYTKSGDAIHPDEAGHKVLGNWLAGQIKTALNA